MSPNLLQRLLAAVPAARLGVAWVLGLALLVGWCRGLPLAEAFPAPGGDLAVAAAASGENRPHSLIAAGSPHDEAAFRGAPAGHAEGCVASDSESDDTPPPTPATAGQRFRCTHAEAAPRPAASRLAFFAYQGQAPPRHA